MRIAGLLVLAVLLPAFVSAAELVNINTADIPTLVSSLAGTGVGLAKATAIVDYRNANGLFATIQDITKVTGIKEATFTAIKPFITVGDTSVVNNSNTSDTSNTASSTQDTSASSEDTTTYTPQSSALTLDAGTNQDATMEVPLPLSARVTMKGGAIDPLAHIVWGFGDGSSAEGRVVEKTYRYAGKYLVVVTATDGIATGRDEFIVTVRPAQVSILGIPGTGVMVTNEASERLDLSGWTLFANTTHFQIPNGTIILPKSSVLFSSTITKVSATADVVLAYPGGGIAARSVPPTLSTEQQPSSLNVSYQKVQEVVEPPVASRVEPISSTTANIQTHAEAVRAPTVAVEPAAVGAALIPPSSAIPVPRTSSGIFHSPWTLGLLGVIAAAGGAFILL